MAAGCPVAKKPSSKSEIHGSAAARSEGNAMALSIMPRPAMPTKPEFHSLTRKPAPHSRSPADILPQSSSVLVGAAAVTMQHATASINFSMLLGKWLNEL